MSYPSDHDVINVDDIEGRKWKQHPDESDKAYRAFQAYKDLGRERTKLKAYCVYSGKDEEEVAQAPTHIYEWNKKFAWGERVKAWDEHQDELKEKKFEEEAEEYAKDMAQSAQVVAKSVLQGLENRFEDKSPDEIEEMLFEEDSMDLEAISRTLATSRGIAQEAFGRLTSEDNKDEGDFLMTLKELDG